MPEGWRKERLGALAVFVGRGMAPTYTEQDSEVRAINQRCVRGGRVRAELSKAHDPSVPVRPDAILRQGDICINSTGTGTIGRVGLWSDNLPGSFFADSHITIIRTIMALVASKFLTEVLSSAEVQRLMEVNCFSGSTNQVELDRSSLRGLDLLIPPLGEQRKIAAILSSLNDAIEATQAVIEQVEVMKTAMLAELLTHGIPGHHSHLTQSKTGLVPSDWAVMSFGELITRGPDNGLYKPQSAYGEGSRIVRITDFTNGDEIVTASLRRVTAKEEDYRRFSLRAGDLLINRVNSLSHIGKAAIVGSVDETLLFESNIMRVTVDESFLIPRFALLILSSPQARTFFRTHAKPAVAQASINQQDLRALPFPLPPLREQKRIVAVTSAITTRRFAEEANLRALSRLKSTLLTSLLTGEIRVPTDEAPA